MYQAGSTGKAGSIMVKVACCIDMLVSSVRVSG